MARRGKTVTVRKHTRTPRGANRGKPRPKVKAYSRKRPNPASYPR